MSYTLLIMAAGLGSRFGGDKQLASVGPNGEAFFDYAIRDATASGADKVLMIVRSEIEDAVASHVEEIHGDSVEVSYVRQDTFGPSRAKPWGTAHAVLAAAEAVDQPFLVVNADDYYGQRSYALAAESIAQLADGECVVVAFELGRTLPEAGAVSRGVCEIDAGALVEITETHGIARKADGTIASEDPPGVLTDETPVSMNMWGFRTDLFDHLSRMWKMFHSERGDEEKSEFLLPEAVGELMIAGEMSVTAATTDDDWIGVTNPDDLEPARAILASRT